MQLQTHVTKISLENDAENYVLTLKKNFKKSSSITNVKFASKSSLIEDLLGFVSDSEYLRLMDLCRGE